MPGASEYAVLVEGLEKSYSGKPVLRSVSLRVARGEVYAVLGPNGAGKSTLFSIIAGVTEPSRGRVEVYGQPPRSPRVKELIGYAPQEHGLVERLSGYDNIAFYARLRGVPVKEAARQVKDHVDALGLGDALAKKVAKYSGGMKRKLSLVIALLGDPELLVLDEPTSGLDPESRRTVWEIIRGLRRGNRTVLLATHYTLEAERLADRVAIMDRGRIIVEDEPLKLIEKYGPPSVVEAVLEEEPSPPLLEEAKTLGEVVVEGNRLRFYTSDPDSFLPVLAGFIAARRVRVEAIRVLRPSLDDVFARLVGGVPG